MNQKTTNNSTTPSPRKEKVASAVDASANPFDADGAPPYPSSPVAPLAPEFSADLIFQVQTEYRTLEMRRMPPSSLNARFMTPFRDLCIWQIRRVKLT